MSCFVCGTANPATNRFCGQCGAALDSAAEKLQQHVIEIVRKNIKDSDAMAADISKKVEDLLWRWGKVLGLAASLLAAALFFFGFTTFTGAKDRISQATIAATGRLNDTASAKKSDLEKQAVALSGELTTEAQQAESVIHGYGVRENAVGANLRRLEGALTKQNDQMKQLNRIRANNPDTPIGSITGQLFQTTNLTVPIGLSTVPTYSLKSSGEGVKAIQLRLGQLNCYSGQISGEFDAATVAGVIAFEAAQNKPIGDRKFSSIFAPPDSTLQPGPDQIDNNPGDVGYTTWNELFSPFGAICN